MSRRDWVEESSSSDDVVGIWGLGSWMFLSDEMALDGVSLGLEDTG